MYYRDVVSVMDTKSQTKEAAMTDYYPTPSADCEPRRCECSRIEGNINRAAEPFRAYKSDAHEVCNLSCDSCTFERGEEAARG